MEVELVPISWLKPLEEVTPSNVDSLHDITLRWNAYTKPLLVDGRAGTILDGHHRYHVGLRIGLLRLPVIKVDYLDDKGIELDIWPGCDEEALTEQEVVEMALSGKLYPPKTSRHRYSDYLPAIAVPLDSMRSE